MYNQFKTSIMRFFIILLFLSISPFLFSQQTQSPYLQISSKNSVIPLKSTTADVQITGTIAHVHISQTYQNLGKSAIEAKYVFPMSTKAAVHNMEMTIGNRTTKAIVYEKQKAAKIYQKAIKKGKRAAKLDQERPNVLQMKVGNILPNDEVVIDIYYTEMLTSINGEYQFIFPGVVGPRFTGESLKNEITLNSPYTEKGISDSFTYGISLCINAGMMIQQITSNTHKINVQYPDVNSAEITLSASNINPSNRDFILNYSLRGNKLNTGFLLYEGKDENFFSLLIQPSKEIVQTEIPPREYVFIIDVSGSMIGYPVEVAKSLLRKLLINLQQDDTFNIVLFSADNTIFKQKSVAATQENVTAAIQFLSGKYSNYGGGSRLLHALSKSYKLPRNKKSVSRNMVILTDGYISVEKDVFQLIENNLDNANVFTFGIGSSVNRYLIEGMAKVGRSASFIATNKAAAFKVADEFQKYIASPLLTQIQLKTNGFDIYDVEPKTIPDVLSDRPVLIYGKYKGKATGSITLTGFQGNKKVSSEIMITTGKLSKQHKALRYLWARKKIERLADYQKNFRDDVQQEVIQLGLRYNLLTQYTSFVAVDTEIVNKKGKLKTVKQPLPMPMNVANSAVGAAASISGKSIYKKSFNIQIQFSHQKNKQQKRALKMWLKGSFSSLIKMYVKKYSKIRLQVHANGKIVKIEKEVNGLWVSINSLPTLFEKLPNHIKIEQKMSITFSK